MSSSPSNIFPSVVGQDRPKSLLLRAIRTGRMAHAYLFIGPEGSGKLPLALEFARVLSCEQGPELGAVGHCKCRSCLQMRQIAKVRHPNLTPVFPLPLLEKDKGEPARLAFDETVEAIEADPYGTLKFAGATSILIDQVRELRNNLSLSADRSGVRTAIVFPADRMNDNAANALLKLLEEPPEQCLLILIAESTRELLPTIVSRCQQISFAPLNFEQLTEGLVARNISREKAALVAPLAGGSLTHALQLVGEKTEEMTNECLEFLRAVVVGNVHKANEWIERWTASDHNRADLEEKLDFVGLWLKDALIIKAFAEQSVGRLQIPNGKQAADRIAARYSVFQLEKTLIEVEETKLALQSNAMPAMALNALAIRVHRVLT